MKAMKVLHLILKHRWFDMIASGEKPEEYRDKTPYYDVRFFSNGQPRHYDAVCLHRGYTNTTIPREYHAPRVGYGRPEWGAPDREVYILDVSKEVRP